MSLGPTFKMENLQKNFTWWTICGLNVGTRGGASMNHKTFGNMIHPKAPHPSQIQHFYWPNLFAKCKLHGTHNTNTSTQYNGLYFMTSCVYVFMTYLIFFLGRPSLIKKTNWKGGKWLDGIVVEKYNAFAAKTFVP